MSREVRAASGRSGESGASRASARYPERRTSRFARYAPLIAHSYEKGGDLGKSVQAWEHASALEPGDLVVKQNLERVKKLEAEEPGRK